MSYLIRTGTGRNNISWSNTANSSTKYLRRVGSGRNNVAWTTIPNGSTYNILNRNGTGRNNILWANLTIMSSQMAKIMNLINIIGESNIYNGGFSQGAHSAFESVVDGYTVTKNISANSISLDIYGDPNIWPSSALSIGLLSSRSSSSYGILFKLMTNSNAINAANQIVNDSAVYHFYLSALDADKNPYTITWSGSDVLRAIFPRGVDGTIQMLAIGPTQSAVNDKEGIYLTKGNHVIMKIY